MIIGYLATPTARAQCDWVGGLLEGAGFSDFEFLCVDKSGGGDPSSKPGAIELAPDYAAHTLHKKLLNREIDAALYELYRLTGKFLIDLDVACVLARRSPQEALYCPSGKKLEELPEGAKVGGNPLRQTQYLTNKFPHLVPVSVGGSLEQALDWVDRGMLDAAVIPLAELEFMGREHGVSQVFSYQEFPSAACQGAYGLELHGDVPQAFRSVLNKLEHTSTRLQIVAERSLAAALAADANSCIGASATLIPAAQSPGLGRAGGQWEINLSANIVGKTPENCLKHVGRVAVGNLLARRGIRIGLASAAACGSDLANDLKLMGSKAAMDEFSGHLSPAHPHTVVYQLKE